jgi:hypothetical protein
VLSSPHKFLPKQHSKSQARCQANATIPACPTTALPPGRKEGSFLVLYSNTTAARKYPSSIATCDKVAISTPFVNRSSAENSKSKKTQESRPTLRFSFLHESQSVRHGCQYRLPGTKSRRYGTGQTFPLGLGWGWSYKEKEVRFRMDTGVTIGAMALS